MFAAHVNIGVGVGVGVGVGADVDQFARVGPDCQLAG